MADKKPTPTEAKQAQVRGFLLSRGYTEYAPGYFAKTKPSKPIADGFTRWAFAARHLKLQRWDLKSKSWWNQKPMPWGSVGINADGTKICYTKKPVEGQGA